MIELIIYIIGYVLAYFACRQVHKNAHGKYVMKDKALYLFVSILSWVLVGGYLAIFAIGFVLKGVVHIIEKDWWDKEAKW